MVGVPPSPGLRVPLASTLRGYCSWMLIAVAYAVAFFQRVSPQTVIDVLQRDLGMDVRGAGILASAYFCGYTAMQIPAGILVDTFSVRGVILTSLAVSSAGLMLFSLSSDLSSAFAARLLVAIGDALVFTALIKLVAQQFPDNRFGLYSGISQVSGFIGGMMATTPLAIAVSTIGWRHSFLNIAILTLANLGALWLILPSSTRQIDGHKIAHLFSTILQTFKRVWVAARSAESWGCALTFCFYFVVATTLSGVWGIPMLMNAYGFDRSQASMPMLLFMVGTIIGTVGLSIIADRTASLFNWLIIACLARILLLALILPIIGNALGAKIVFASFMLLGLTGGGSMPLMLKTTKRVYSVAFIGVGSSINTTAAAIMTAVVQPLIGFVLSINVQDTKLETLGEWSGYDRITLIFSRYLASRNHRSLHDAQGNRAISAVAERREAPCTNAFARSTTSTVKIIRLYVVNSCARARRCC